MSRKHSLGPFQVLSNTVKKQVSQRFPVKNIAPMTLPFPKCQKCTSSFLNLVLPDILEDICIGVFRACCMKCCSPITLTELEWNMLSSRSTQNVTIGKVGFVVGEVPFIFFTAAVIHVTNHRTSGVKDRAKINVVFFHCSCVWMMWACPQAKMWDEYEFVYSFVKRWDKLAWIYPACQARPTQAPHWVWCSGRQEVVGYRWTDILMPCLRRPCSEDG